jgi:iron complex transport system permease protein
MFRNALATPSVIGTEAGAAFALALFVLCGGPLTGGHPFLATITGATLVTAISLMLTRFDRSPSMTKLLLGGFAINAMLAAGTSLCVSVLMERGDGLTLYHWLLGSFTARTWDHAATAAAGLFLFGFVALMMSPIMDVMALGSTGARAVGVRAERARALMVLLIAALSGSSIACGGALPFIGLMAPHMARLLGPPHFRRLAPLAAVLGAALTVSADLCARTLRAPIDMDVGIMTTILGAPYFIWLLSRAHNDPQDSPQNTEACTR